MTCDRPPASPPLRVVLYTDSAGMGGAEISLGHLVAHVSESVALTVVGVDETVVNAIANRRPHTPRLLLPVWGGRAFFQHRATFGQLQPDIVHCNLCVPWAGQVGLAAALTLSRARVVRVDQLPLRTTAAIALWSTRALSLRVDAHVAVGQVSARRMEDFYALGRDSVISIPNGVPDVWDIPPLPPHATQNHLVVGSVGRLDAMKAHDVLLRAIAQTPNTEAVILGEGSQRMELERLALALGIQDRVRLPGWADEPTRHLADFDVVALPSRSEGFPLAMVEAMLAARPVVATRVGSMPEAITDGETGVLIEKNDVAGLAAALARLRDQPEWRDRLGRQGRARAIAHYTAAAMTQQYEQLWQKLLTQPQAPRLRVPLPKA